MSKIPIVAIVGRTNVGKSSIFNRLIEKRQAIVSDTSGTTRDSVYGLVNAKKRFWAVDTAGLKTPEDDFELSIQEQLVQASESADMLVVVAEKGIPITEHDRRAAKLALKSKKPTILAINKCDKKSVPDTDFKKLGIKTIIEISAEHKHNIDELISVIEDHIDTRSVSAPDTEGLKIAFVGRPNVGKSSLFNKLSAKQLAVVSDVAGTTRDTNRRIVGYYQKSISLLDTAGIRRPGKVGKDVEYFSVLRALSAIDEADVCCLVIDAQEPATKLDLKIAGMVKEAGKGLIIIVSKWDLIDKDAFTHDQMAARISSQFTFTPWAPLLFTSSVSGQNVSKLFKMSLDIYKRRQVQIPTSKLNTWLKQTTIKHPPAGLKSTRPKLNYIVQLTDRSGPTFRVYGRSLKTLHWSYKRYMDREIRELEDFAGSAVTFEFSNNEHQGK